MGAVEISSLRLRLRCRCCHLTIHLIESPHNKVMQRIYSIVWHCVIGIVPAYLLDLFILILRLALVANLSAWPPEVTLWCLLLLALLPDRKRLSRLWVPLFGIVSPLTSVPCRGIFLVIFIDSSRLSSLAEPALNSYREGALYKFNISSIDRM